MPQTKQQPMKTIAQCAQCGRSFGSAYEVKMHIRDTHIPDRLKKKEEVKDEAPVLGKVPEGGTATEKQIVQPQPVQTVSPPPNPIVLKYKFIGQCPVCNHEPRTLILEVGEEIYAVCYCSSCDKKLKQIKVISLDYQYEKTTQSPKANRR